MTMNRFPTDDQIATALLWLNINEGESAERESCLAVAHWLKTEAESRLLRAAAKKGGVRTADLRFRLKAQGDFST